MNIDEEISEINKKIKKQEEQIEYLKKTMKNLGYVMEIKLSSILTNQIRDHDNND